MNMHELRKTRISYSLFDVVYKYLELEKRIRFFGTDKPLYFSEIHIISVIKENEGIHITGLANKMGVTKGAVSQILMKLEKKGFITKERDADNQSRFLIKLTPKGEIAHDYHLKFHKDFDDMLYGLLKDESQEKIQFLKSFLQELEDKLQAFENKNAE